MILPVAYTYSANGPWKESLNFIFPIKYGISDNYAILTQQKHDAPIILRGAYGIPKSLKVGHWLNGYNIAPPIFFDIQGVEVGQKSSWAHASSDFVGSWDIIKHR